MDVEETRGDDDESAAAAGADGGPDARGARPHGEWIGLLRRRWPAVTAVAVATAVVLGLRTGVRADLPAVLYLAVLGVLLTYVDVKLMRLPDPLTLPSYAIGATLLGIAAPFTGDGAARYLQALTGMVVLWLCYAVQWFVVPHMIGLGDVKLAGVLGLYLGWYGLGAGLAGVVIMHVLAGSYAVVLLATRRAGPRSQFAFGPFMIMGTLTAVALYAPLG